MSISMSDLRILAVDDNAPALNLLMDMLAKLKVTQVYSCVNGKEALDFLGSCEDLVDLVICDWNMPEMTGIQLLKQIRTVDLEMPFLMVTGAVDMASVIEARRLDVTGYIAKPYSQDELERKLRVICRMIGPSVPQFSVA